MRRRRRGLWLRGGASWDSPACMVNVGVGCVVRRLRGGAVVPGVSVFVAGPTLRCRVCGAAACRLLPSLGVRRRAPILSHMFVIAYRMDEIGPDWARIERLLTKHAGLSKWPEFVRT